MSYTTIAQLSQGLKDGTFSSRELTQDVIADIKLRDHQYNSFITLSEELALAQAEAADKRIAAGQAATMTGVPIAHKDLFCTQGVRTTAASKILENFVPPYELSLIHI